MDEHNGDPSPAVRLDGAKMVAGGDPVIVEKARNLLRPRLALGQEQCAHGGLVELERHFLPGDADGQAIEDGVDRERAASGSSLPVGAGAGAIAEPPRWDAQMGGRNSPDCGPMWGVKEAAIGAPIPLLR